ncbi:hypothetical protein AAII07_54040, partial [Microvirga sp. 0TCS3.31]
LPILNGSAQGHRRLRFSSPLNNVKEHLSHLETGKNLKPPGFPCGTIQSLKPPPAATSVAAVDEPYLVNAPTGVNSNRQEFKSSSRSNAAAAQVQTQLSRSQK